MHVNRILVSFSGSAWGHTDEWPRLVHFHGIACQGEILFGRNRRNKPYTFVALAT